MRTKDEVAEELARIHYEVEPGLTRVIRFTGAADPDEPIKLLEVNESTVPSGVMPLRFGPIPHHGIDYPSVIIEVTPEEYRKIEANELLLPADWGVGTPIPRTAVVGR